MDPQVLPQLTAPAAGYVQSKLAIDMPMDTSSDSDTDYTSKPRSILKSRDRRRSTRSSSPRRLSLFGCSLRLPISAHCARRHNTRVTFRASVEVTEYSKAIGRDGVPADGSDLAIGLGKETWKGLAPLVFSQPGWFSCEKGPSLTLPYIPVERREELLEAAMGKERFYKVVDSHRSETAEIIRLRKEAREDEKEPPQLMPVSYQQAKDRAQAVAAEVRSAATCSDTLAMSVAMADFAMECKKIAPVISSAAAPAGPASMFTCLKRKRPLTNSTSKIPKVVCIEEGTCKAKSGYTSKYTREDEEEMEDEELNDKNLIKTSSDLSSDKSLEVSKGDACQSIVKCV